MTATEHTTPRRKRQLVVCCDGTNNTLTAGKADTNVLQLYEHLMRHRPGPGADFERVLFYDPGVGVPDAAPPTDPVDWIRRTWERVSGLAQGRGIYDNVASAYRFLMLNWRDDHDEIYCFGFSRGAFTARAVVGMVHLFGVVEPQHEAMIPTLVHIYFSLPRGNGNARWWQRATRDLQQATTKKNASGKARLEDGRQELANQVRNFFTSPAGYRARVHWAGVWDTVESVGLPGPLSRSNPSVASFVNKRIDHVRHAVAFDEHRWSFLPRLYEEPGDVSLPAEDGIPARTAKQRFFPGVHCDVGGSYKVEESGLADRAFVWMVNEVSPYLNVPPVAPKANHAPERHDALYDTPAWALAGMCVRDMQPRTARGEPIAVLPVEDIGGTPLPAMTSVWDKRRALWPVVIAVLLGIAFVWLSGLRLLEPGLFEPTLDNFRTAVAAAVDYATLQREAATGGGVLVSGNEPWNSPFHPAWAMVWDLAFVGAYGYLVSRIGSRAFTWLAGERRPGEAMPWWRALGMAPLALVAGDVVADSCTLLAMLAQWSSVHWLAVGLLWIGGIASYVEVLGALGCAALLLVRIVMMVAGGKRVGAVH
jgi:uncharacterized protein (DUF2235 family)